MVRKRLLDTPSLDPKRRERLPDTPKCSPDPKRRRISRKTKSPPAEDGAPDVPERQADAGQTGDLPRLHGVHAAVGAELVPAALAGERDGLGAGAGLGLHAVAGE